MRNRLSPKANWMIFGVIAVLTFPALVWHRYSRGDVGWQPWQRATNILLIAVVVYVVQWHFMTDKKQFSVRSLFLLATVVAITLGAIAYWGF